MENYKISYLKDSGIFDFVGFCGTKVWLLLYKLDNPRYIVDRGLNLKVLD
jgi:hypothetical protein